MAATDNIQDNKSTTEEELRARYEQLKGMQQSGELDDAARSELDQLRSRFESSNGS